jgi:hypothetical protein
MDIRGEGRALSTDRLAVMRLTHASIRSGESEKFGAKGERVSYSANGRANFGSPKLKGRDGS